MWKNTPEGARCHHAEKKLNRKLGLAHAHFKAPEKTNSCLSHAKFTIVEKNQVVAHLRML